MQEVARVAVGTDEYGTYYLILSQELVSQSIANNSSVVKLKLSLYCPVWINTVRTTLVIGDSSINIGPSWNAGTHEIWNNGSGWTLGHGATGKLDYTFTASINSTYLLNGTISKKIVVPDIPRYTTASQSLNSKTETTIKMNWSATNTVDYIWYSINNGSSWTGIDVTDGTSGSYTISGLSAGTAYNIKTRVRRKDSQLTTDTSSLTVNTYDYPRITAVETSNLIIGNSQKLTIYNPLSRNVTIKMLKDNGNGTQLYSGTTTGTSITFTPNSTTLYNSIPNSKSSNCVYSCIYGTVTKTTQNRTYAINENNCKPTFANFTYADTGNLTSNYNGTVINTGIKISQLTGNAQLLVNGYSTCKFVISTTNKAIAKNGSSIIKYKFEWGAKSEEVEYSSNQEVNSFISYSTGNTLKVTAIDSRGLSTTVTKTVPVISYVNAKINEVITQRKNGVNVETYLAFKATIWNGNWNNSSNSNYANQLKYVGYRVYNGSTWTGYFDITQEVKELMTTSTSGNSTTINLSISKQLPIHANGTSDGFEIGKQYTIQLLIRDGTSSYTFTSYNYQATAQGTVTDGKVGLSRYKDNNGDYHYGINEMPEDDYALAVNGNIKADDLEINPTSRTILNYGFRYRKVGMSLVECVCYTNGNDIELDSSQNLLIGTMPISYRPLTIMTIPVVIVISGGNYVTNGFYLQINIEGEVRLYNRSGTKYKVYSIYSPPILYSSLKIN